jgi:malate/lactate dehydrogenase
MCLSLPCVVGARGVEEILTLNLDPAEESGFRESAAKLKSLMEPLDPS